MIVFKDFVQNRSGYIAQNLFQNRQNKHNRSS